VQSNQNRHKGRRQWLRRQPNGPVVGLIKNKTINILIDQASLEKILMLKLSNVQIDATRQSELRFKLDDSLKPRNLLFKSSTALSEDDFATLYDACMDVLHNEAPGVQEFTAVQDLGPYPIWIRGVSGAYFVEAWSTMRESSSRLLRKPAHT
jgi:hypothetical protein